MAAAVTFYDLEAALYWVSAGAPSENAAYISKETGQVFYASSVHDTEDELPEDVDDASLYWSVPHKNELDLGRDLVFRFVDEHLCAEYRTVQSYFHHRGAYSRFKDLLSRLGELDRWHEFERTATELALREWASENGLAIEPPSPKTEA
jgi:hypothetical protein